MDRAEPSADRGLLGRLVGDRRGAPTAAAVAVSERVFSLSSRGTRFSPYERELGAIYQFYGPDYQMAG